MKNTTSQLQSPQPRDAFDTCVEAPFVFPVTSVNIQTGSDVLDGLLAQSGAGIGQVLHIKGGLPDVQRAALLALCKAACDRGESSVFFDLLGTLDLQTIQRAGLSLYCGTSRLDDPEAQFRVLSPETTAQLGTQLKALTQLTSYSVTTVVAVEGLPELLERHHRQGRAKQKYIIEAGRELYRLLHKMKRSVEYAHCIVWIAHTPFYIKKHAGCRPALPPQLETTIQNTLKNHVHYGLDVLNGQHRDDQGMDHCLRVWVYSRDTVVAGPGDILISNTAQFKNT